MFIGDSYLDLYKEIRRLAALDRMPGSIGKSVSLWYFAYRLLHEDDVSAVGIRCGDFKFVAVRAAIGFQIHNLKHQSGEVVKESGRWMLLDQGYALGELTGAHTILFASPEAKNWKEFHKLHRPSFFRQYMPVWTCEELLELRAVDCAKMLDYEEVLDRLSIQGGVSGVIFAPEEDLHKSKLKQRIRALTWNDVSVWLYEMDSSYPRVCHSVFHLCDVSKDFRFAKLDFGSKFIQDYFFRSTALDAIQDIVSRIIDDDTLRGKCLEYYARLALASGCKLKLRCLSHKLDDLEVGCPQRRTYIFKTDENLEKLKNPATYYLKPCSKTFESIDSILPPDVLFQISAGVKKHIKLKGLAAGVGLLLKYDNDCKHLIFVTISDKAMEYKEVPCEVPEVNMGAEGFTRKVNVKVQGFPNSDLVQWVCTLEPSRSDYIEVERLFRDVAKRDSAAFPDWKFPTDLGDRAEESDEGEPMEA